MAPRKTCSTCNYAAQTREELFEHFHHMRVHENSLDAAIVFGGSAAAFQASTLKVIAGISNLAIQRKKRMPYVVALQPVGLA